jgi:hypothetical protein
VYSEQKIILLISESSKLVYVLRLDFLENGEVDLKVTKNDFKMQTSMRVDRVKTEKMRLFVMQVNKTYYIYKVDDKGKLDVIYSSYDLADIHFTKYKDSLRLINSDYGSRKGDFVYKGVQVTDVKLN